MASKVVRRGKEVTELEIDCLTRDLEVAREDLGKAVASEKKAAKLAEARKVRLENLEAKLAEIVTATRSLGQKARGKGPRTKAAKALAASKAESQRVRGKRDRAAAALTAAREDLVLKTRHQKHVAAAVARILGQITAEKQRRKRVELREKKRAYYLQQASDDAEKRKQTPVPEQEGEPVKPPGKRTYSNEDKRLLAEMCEAWMKSFLVPCAAANMGGSFIHRYCESHDVDGQVRIGIPMVPDATIDMDEDDLPPGLPLVLADTQAIVKDLGNCINASRIMSEPVFVAETYYQVGWLVSYPTGTKVKSEANLFLPSHLSTETGQMVETYVVVSHWVRGEYQLPLTIAHELLRRDDQRGYLDVNHASGEPVGLEFFFNLHWGPDEVRPPRVPDHMEIWSDLLEVEA